MKKLLLILLSTLSLMTFAQNKSVAILNPLDRDGSVSSMYKIIVRSSFETVASVTQGYEAFDRTALDAIMSEHNFQRSGAVNDAEIRQIGQMAGVDYVLVTEVSAESDYMVVQAKILNVVTAKYDRAVDDLMQMTPPAVKEGCSSLAQRLFRINMQTGNQKGEINYNGHRYVGEYKDGKPNGKGKLYYSEGEYSSFEGDFINGRREGYGVMIWKEGSRYEGNWINDEMEGMGTMYLSNGRYEGTFNRGSFEKGTLYFSGGSKYEGTFVNNRPQGYGTFYYKSGDKYVGEFDDGEFEGNGILYYTNGNKYEGKFANGKQNGSGTFTDHWGNKYTGSWKNNEMEGEFFVSLNDGTAYKALFANGDMVKVLKKLDDRFVQLTK